MEARFAKLRPYDVIDLCYEDQRYPAIVTKIDLLKRAFTVLRLDRAMVQSLVEGGVMPDSASTVMVRLPATASEVHPQWAVVGK